MSAGTSAIAANLQRILERIARAAERARRRADEITLVAVAKTFPAAPIREAYAAGVRHFGENRMQEWEGKHPQLSDLEATWHLVGHLQSNKARRAARLFHAVDSLDRLELAQKLDRAVAEETILVVGAPANVAGRAAPALPGQPPPGSADILIPGVLPGVSHREKGPSGSEKRLPAEIPPGGRRFSSDISAKQERPPSPEAPASGSFSRRMVVLIEVRLAPEETKSGATEEDLPRLAEAVLALPHLDLRGLMCIPPLFENPEDVRPHFRKLRQLRDALSRELGCPLPELSMGMSHDFGVAIEEGATQVRLGTAIFGGR